MSLSWRVQNIVVIGRIYIKLERSEFSSNFEFDRNMLSGTGSRPDVLMSYSLLRLMVQHADSSSSWRLCCLDIHNKFCQPLQQFSSVDLMRCWWLWAPSAAWPWPHIMRIKSGDSATRCIASHCHFLQITPRFAYAIQAYLSASPGCKVAIHLPSGLGPELSYISGQFTPHPMRPNWQIDQLILIR